MEKFVSLVIDFAKDNGVGVVVPLAIWLVAKVVVEDYKANKDVSVKNHDSIEALALKLAAVEAKLESLEKAVY